ncbi:hypothetical protein [Paenibacillus pini]|uniref:Uncharacterized protein n=1 Tax=Paenibacillus pini JCM 16418 TaxID=1236976 RepID=W7YUK1_9BACL|nr:hypothetical protein [Paenibacillus pini]GAF10898.1 hypothetical protein JCM16418_5131 [Paenibacillus pini JCM 16418]
MSKKLICHAPHEPYFTVSNIYSVAREETNEDGVPFLIIIDNEGDEYSIAAVTGHGEYSYDFNFYLMEE